MADLTEHYLSLGWWLFPIRQNDKRPATPRGFLDASNDRETVSRWFNDGRYNVGIATGASGLVVIDVDGETGWQSLRQWEREHGRFPHTYMAETPNGGLHLYYRRPEGVTIRSTVGLLSGIDVRAEGGYVLAAPSRIVADTGEIRRYSWVGVRPPWPGEIAEYE